MVFKHLISLPWHYVISFLLVSIVFKVAVNKLGNGLTSIPGPWLASCSDLWRLFVVWSRRPELIHIRLHEKYGNIVRIGPRNVSVADPEAIKVIYSPKSDFVKSGFYPVQQTIANGHALQSIFNTTDERFHAKLRRAVSNAYAMSTLVNFEPLVDSTSNEFLKQLKRRYADRKDSSGICDLGAWLQYYAFDVIGELTYSTRLGFLDRGSDVDNIIADLEWLLDYVAVIGQLPYLDRLLLKNPIRLWLSKLNVWQSTSPVVVFAKKHMAHRRDTEGAVIKTVARESMGRDFLSRFKEARLKDPDFISEQRVLALTVANMFAGSDTTAITLRGVFYYLLKNPSAMEKLTAELSRQSKAGKLTRDDALVRWDEVRDLPYLGAVIKEALRCHPAVGLPLERVVPPAGINLCGHHIPGGTIVGCSAWVMHRNEAIFGPAAHEFHPERWMEAPMEQQIKMNNTLFSFGAGSRTCLGKHISQLEIYKLVPAVIRMFELDLADPKASWTLHNAWFVKQSGIKVRLKSREAVL